MSLGIRITLSASVVAIAAGFSQRVPGQVPQTCYWEPERLVAVKNSLQDEAATLEPVAVEALERLRAAADRALKRGPYSVVDKDDTPPSGDKHDYLSYSRYWWPDPDSSDGLPYIRRDGVVNAEMRARGDRDAVGSLIDDVETLALAYYFFNDNDYAAHAARLIRTWFLRPETRMNPNLNYGQAVLGRSEGRSVGIIDTRGFMLVLDGLELVKSSSEISPAEVEALRGWFAEFLTWLLTSDLGIEEGQRENNHGAWYAAQTARIALFTGEDDVAVRMVKQVRDKRIPLQFERDGSQPAELERTRSLHYSLFNLAALAAVARTGDCVGVDLWDTPSGESGFQSGLQYLVPYLLAQQTWPHPQIGNYEVSPRVVQLLRMASYRYQSRDYQQILNSAPRRHAERNFAALQFRTR